MWFSIFSTKKVILSKKSIFRLIMTSNVFQLKTIFYIGKMVSKKFWRPKKVFPATWERGQIDPPQSCCWENVKKCQNFTYGYFVKNSKNTIINRETVFTKIFEKTRTYWDFDENFQKCACRLRVKMTKNTFFNEAVESTLKMCFFSILKHISDFMMIKMSPEVEESIGRNVLFWNLVKKSWIRVNKQKYALFLSFSLPLRNSSGRMKC